MARQYSIAEARNQLSRVVHEAEDDGVVELTRRGRAVAVLVSVGEYERLRQPRPSSVWEAIREYRSQGAHDEDVVLDGLRDPSPGREPEL